MHKVVVSEFEIKDNLIHLNNIEFDNLSAKQVDNLLTLSNKKMINYFHIYRNGKKVFSLYYRAGIMFRLYVNDVIYFQSFINELYSGN